MTNTVFGKSSRGRPGQLGLLPGFEPEAAAFYRTSYEGIRRLICWMDKRGFALESFPLFVEPCAGDGAVIKHIRRFMTEHGRTWEPAIHLVEMRDERLALNALNVARLESPKPIQKAIGSIRSDGIAITNLPWYETTIDVVEGFWRRYPNTPLIALLCSQFVKDATRPDWLHKHMPEYILRHGGRMRLKGRKNNAYPFPVEWLFWRPGGARGTGRLEILTPTTCAMAPA